MNIDTLMDKIGDYLVGTVSSNVKSPVTKFALGAAASASGKKILAAKIAPLVAVIADENGEFQPEAVKDMLVSGIRMSGKMPVLGGLLTLDADDVEKFCEGL